MFRDTSFQLVDDTKCEQLIILILTFQKERYFNNVENEIC